MEETLLTQSLTNLGKDGMYVVCDTESTGFAPNDIYGKLLQVSAIKLNLAFDWQNRVIKRTKPESFDSYVNPELPFLPPRKSHPDEKRRSKIPKKIVELTGITDEDVADAPVVKDVLKDFYTFIGMENTDDDFDAYLDGAENISKSELRAIVYHNAPHDINFLHFFGSKYGMDYRSLPAIDTCALAKYLWPDLGKGEYKLEALAKRFSISDPNHHNALNDVQVTLKLLLVEIQELIKKGVITDEGSSILYDKVESSFKYDVVRMSMWETPDKLKRRIYVVVKDNRSYANVWYDFVSNEWGQKKKDADIPIRDFTGIQDKIMAMLGLPVWNWSVVSTAVNSYKSGK